jgi:hypothetical protein
MNLLKFSLKYQPEGTIPIYDELYTPLLQKVIASGVPVSNTSDMDK